MRSILRCAWVAVVLAVAGWGCASSDPSPPRFDVPAGRYSDAFEAARDVLAAERFELERVDAGAGVLSTTAKPTSGLATPWDGEQSTTRQEFEDLGNRQQRRVRVTFEPEPAGPEIPSDLRQSGSALVGRVEVTVERIRRTQWRLETTAVRFSSFAVDPELQSRGMWPQYTVAVAQDPLLAGRLAEEIRRRLERPR